MASSSQPSSLEVASEDDFAIATRRLLIVSTNTSAIKFLVVELFGIISDCGRFWAGFNLTVPDFNSDNTLESDGAGGGNISAGKSTNGGDNGADDKSIIGGGAGGAGGRGGGGGGGDADCGLGSLGNTVVVVVGTSIIVLVSGAVFGLTGLRRVRFFSFLIASNNCCLSSKGAAG